MMRGNTKIFLKFIFSSFSSSLVDLLLFTIFCHMLRNNNMENFSYLVIATVLARIISSVYNFTINYKLVFYSKETLNRAMVKYFILAIVQMSGSALLLELIYPLIGGVEVLVKIIVDVIIFFISFFIQKKFIY